MGFFIRKSFRLGPARLNVSKSGLGASVGVKGLRVGQTPRGDKYLHAGTSGLYYREKLGGGESSPPPGVDLSDLPDHFGKLMDMGKATSDPTLKARVVLKSYELADRMRERDLLEMMAEGSGTREECWAELERLSDAHTPGWRSELPGSAERVEAERNAHRILAGQPTATSVGPGMVILAIIVVVVMLFFYVLSQ